MKTTVVLPYAKETPGTVVYAVKDVTAQAVGQLYVRKKYLQQTDGAWPRSITVTVETAE